ncbi:LCP family protein, partial [Eggerthella lenta]
LVRIDPVGHVITMVSVPRDTPYEYNGKVEKINQMFAVNGAAGAVTAVQDLTGVKISDYVEIEFAGLAEFVDSIGGIYVDVPYTIDYQVYTQDQAPVHIEAGNQLLNGEQCVALARMRTAYGDDQEAIRQSNVRAMAMALMKNVLQAPPVEIPGLIQNLSQCVSTSIDLQTMISLATDFAQAGNPTIYTCTGPYKGDFMEEYGGLWLCYEDPEGWATLMKAVDAGENPEAAETTVNGK